jgi:Arc/MetJ-type ribon-helix-helix transcriptional regulator
MPTISAHLPEATYKRLRARIGRRQNASSFVRAAVEDKLNGRRARDPLQKLHATVSRLQELLEDEMDIRVAEERMERLARGEEKILTSEEVWNELGI